METSHHDIVKPRWHRIITLNQNNKKLDCHCLALILEKKVSAISTSKCRVPTFMKSAWTSTGDEPRARERVCVYERERVRAYVCERETLFVYVCEREYVCARV